MKQHRITYHNVPRETFDSVDVHISNKREKLEKYVEQLRWWNERVNLVSRSVSRETLWDHIQHSLLLTELPIFKKSQIIVDAGTGGGLPGIPLAIANPQKEFILNDIAKKKILAVKQIIKKLSLTNTSIAHGSIANLEIEQPFHLISKHAFKINELFHMTEHFTWERLTFYKGTNFENELEGIKHPLHIDGYRFFPKNRKDFYQGKVLVSMTK